MFQRTDEDSDRCQDKGRDGLSEPGLVESKVPLDLFRCTAFFKALHGCLHGDVEPDNLDDAVDVSGLSAATITTIDGTAANVAFAVGDVLHAQDDIIVGEIASLDADNITFRHDGKNGTPANFAAWQIQNGADAAGDLANNDELFNVNPIKIILHFEK